MIFHDDCITRMQKLIDLGVKVDAIITDPPYEIDYAEWDNKLDWKELFSLFDKLTKDNANLIIFQGWSSVSNTISNIPSNMTLKNWIIYDRIKGRGAKTNLVSTREDILWITKGETTYNKIPSNIKKKTGGLGQKNGCEYRALSNVWTDISPIVPWSKERVSHPTQKPLQLMERCVNIWTNKKDLILDPFMGSGTTLVAAKKLDRDYIGIERNRDYFELAKERISAQSVPIEYQPSII